MSDQNNLLRIDKLTESIQKYMLNLKKYYGFIKSVASNY